MLQLRPNGSEYWLIPHLDTEVVLSTNCKTTDKHEHEHESWNNVLSIISTTLYLCTPTLLAQRFYGQNTETDNHTELKNQQHLEKKIRMIFWIAHIRKVKEMFYINTPMEIKLANNTAYDCMCAFLLQPYAIYCTCLFYSMIWFRNINLNRMRNVLPYCWLKW